MGLLIVLTTVLTLVNLAAVFWAAQFLKRELRRHSTKAEERQAELGGTIRGLSSVLAELRRNLAEMEDQRKADAAAMETPAGLGPEREAAMSKAMEEGIASILAYTSGKAPGVELRL